jgi:hypothetical protein
MAERKMFKEDAVKKPVKIVKGKVAKAKKVERRKEEAGSRLRARKRKLGIECLWTNAGNPASVIWKRVGGKIVIA